MLVIMAGLPASGKSTLARALALKTNGAVIDKDILRAALFQGSDLEYSAEQDDFVMELMLLTAKYLISKNPDRYIFFDGRTFSREYQRQRVIDFGRNLQIPWCLIECVCSEYNACKRLTDALAFGSHPAANRDIELWKSVRDSFEPIDNPKTVINTDAGIDECLIIGLQAISHGLHEENKKKT